MRTTNLICYYSIWCFTLSAVTTTIVVGYTIHTAQQQTNIPSSSSLYSSPPQQRQPRRNLQKRPRKNRKSQDVSQQDIFLDHYDKQSRSHQRIKQQDDFPWETAESRTLIAAAAREAGEDYWIDYEELQKEKQRNDRRVLRDSPGRISDQKLWVEVLSPYKQNWIGLISVSIVAFAFIFKYFPEVISPPVIANIPAVL